MTQSEEYRSVCFDHHGRDCVICGGGEDIIAHHVDGDRGNNDKENLRPMCRSCHRSVHHAGPGMDEWSKKLPERAIIDRPGTDLRPYEIETLAFLADGRSNPLYIQDVLGLDKSTTKTTLVRLGRSGLVRQVTRGLYEITADGRAEIGSRTADVDVTALERALDDIEAACERGDGAAAEAALRRAREAVGDAE